MKVSTFCLIKNEAEFVGYNIMSVLDYVKEMIFFDGNSTDGTLEIIKHIKAKYDKDNKIKLYENKDCKDLQEDYVRLNNEALKECEGEYVMFLHPDMIILNAERFLEIGVQPYKIRYYVNMESFAGDRTTVITDGREKKWATIYRNDYGLHYYGYYGSAEEDLYFSEITGKSHKYYMYDPELSYEIYDSHLSVYHYCDTKPYDRRLKRMINALKYGLYHDKGLSEQDILEYSRSHPRVHLNMDGRTWGGQSFMKRRDPKILQPAVFNKYAEEFEPLRVKAVENV